MVGHLVAVVVGPHVVLVLGLVAAPPAVDHHQGANGGRRVEVSVHWRISVTYLQIQFME